MRLKEDRNMQEEMVQVYLLGKRYTVPSELTIMDAMEYAGYKLVRGCGCRNGFCGACATMGDAGPQTSRHGMTCQRG